MPDLATLDMLGALIWAAIAVSCFVGGFGILVDLVRWFETSHERQRHG